ncbi:MAG: alpha/beta fold hydrolase [Chloroflexi bacterium]|nr:alpha/beta fold hydrolase [Chloroflexota bacterium]
MNADFIHVQVFHPRGRRGTVLLLHGLGSVGETWVGQAPVLRALDLRGLAPDQPGFGRTPWPGGPVTVERYAAFARAVLDRYRVEAAHVAGISFGGTVALQLALDAPERVRSLTLVNTFAHLRPRTLRQWLYFAARSLVTRLSSHQRQAALVARRVFPKPEHAEFRAFLERTIRQADPQVYRTLLRVLWDFDVRPRLAEIRVPTLVVTAAEDTTVPPQVQAELAQGIPTARQVIIPAAGHGVIADQRDAFNRHWQAFLEEVLRTAS